jgi:hypothetical protein
MPAKRLREGIFANPAIGISMSSSEPRQLRECKVYDKTRPSPDWMSLVGTTQCAVFFKDVQTAAALSHEGVAFDRMMDCTFLLFDRLDDARRFCEAQTKEHPWMCCEIFDWEGRAKPPLLVVIDPSVAQKDELSASWVRRRAILAIVLFVCAIPLFVWDWKSEGSLILPTVVGMNMIFLGLRFLYWNTARNERAREQGRRREEHLRREEPGLKAKNI